jgi:hypothetical protein
LHELPGVPRVATVAGAVGLATTEQWLWRERGRVVDRSVGKELGTRPDAVAIRECACHGEGPLYVCGKAGGVNSVRGGRRVVVVRWGVGREGLAATVDLRSCHTTLDRGPCRHSRRRGCARRSFHCPQCRWSRRRISTCHTTCYDPGVTPPEV